MKWPPKRAGACSNAPTQNLKLPQTTAPLAPLQACEHRATVTQRLPDGHLHFSKEICIVYGAFVRWLPRPEFYPSSKQWGDYRWTVTDKDTAYAKLRELRSRQI
jgi:hypothetical protein